MSRQTSPSAPPQHAARPLRGGPRRLLLELPCGTRAEQSFPAPSVSGQGARSRGRRGPPFPRLRDGRLGRAAAVAGLGLLGEDGQWVVVLPPRTSGVELLGEVDDGRGRRLEVAREELRAVVVGNGRNQE